MKTPRELLLARHQEAGPKLDALRHEVVARLRLRAAPVPGAATCASRESAASGQTDGGRSPGHNPVGVEEPIHPFPRAGAERQPWAGGHNPFGIAKRAANFLGKMPNRRSGDAGGPVLSPGLEPLDAGARPSTPGAGVPPFRFQILGWFAPLWRELVWPCRRTWAALASVWVVLFVINTAQEDDSPASVARARASAELFMTYPNQQKLLNELLADSRDPAEADRPRRFIPGPRSETDWMVAA